MGGYRARRILFQRRGALAVRVQRLWNRAPRAQLTIDVGKITLMRMQPRREAAPYVTSALTPRSSSPRPGIRARRQALAARWTGPRSEARVFAVRRQNTTTIPEMDHTFHRARFRARGRVE